MRKANLQTLLIIVASVILLSSCSQVRQITTSSTHKMHLIKADRNATATTKAVSPKITDKKELNALPAKDHEISALQEEKNSAPKLRPVKPSMLHAFISKESKTNSKTEASNKKLQSVNKVLDRLDKINDSLRPSTYVKKWLPYGHSDANKFLFLWIGAVVLAIVFWIVAVAGASGGSLGAFVVFYILGVLCSIAAFVFFIIWLVKLFG